MRYPTAGLGTWSLTEHGKSSGQYMSIKCIVQCTCTTAEQAHPSIAHALWFTIHRLNEGITTYLERKIVGKLHGEQERHLHAMGTV